MIKATFLFFLLLSQYNLFLGQDNFWVQTNGPYGGYVASLGTDSIGVLYAGSGHGYSGIYRSLDDGMSWAISLGDAYAFSFCTLSTGTILAASSASVLKSTDHGVTWTSYGTGLNGVFLNVIGVLDSDVVLVGSYSGVFRSTDGGETWFPSSAGLTSLDIRALKVRNDGVVFIGSSDGYVFFSIDGGETWNPTERDYSYNGVESMEVNMLQDLVLGTTHGIYISTDNGETWEYKSVGIGGGDVRSLQLEGDGDLYAGTGAGVFRSTDNGETWAPFNNGLNTSTVNALLVTPSNTIIAGTWLRGVFRSSNDGTSWTRSGLPSTTVFTIVSTVNYTFAVSSFTTDGLFRTTDRGEAWTQVTNDFEGALTCLASNRAGVLFGGEPYAIVRSTDSGFTWEWLYGTYDNPADLLSIIIHESGTVIGGGWGIVFRSQDEGATWSRIEVPGAFFALSANSTGDIFAAGDNGVYRSTDIGQSWSLIGLENEQVRQIDVGVHNELVAAGTLDGIYISTDNGTTWLNTYPNLNDTTVTGLTHNSSGDIFAATAGKGVLRFRDCCNGWEELDSGLPSNDVYSIAVDSADYVYTGPYSNDIFRSVQATTSVDNNSYRIPIEFFLRQNYPNPFNPSTTLSFTIPQSSIVNLKVFDLLGREVATIVNERLDAGSYTRQWDATGKPSGVYFYRLSVVPTARRDLDPHEGGGQAGGFTETKKLVLLR